MAFKRGTVHRKALHLVAARTQFAKDEVLHSVFVAALRGAPDEVLGQRDLRIEPLFHRFREGVVKIGIKGLVESH